MSTCNTSFKFNISRGFYFLANIRPSEIWAFLITLTYIHTLNSYLPKVWYEKQFLLNFMDYKSSKGKRQSIYQSAAWLHRKNGTKMILVYLVMPTLNDKWYLVHFNFLHRVRDYYTIESEYVKKIIFTLLFLWKKT